MVMAHDEMFLYFLAFMIVLVAFSMRRICIRLALNLLKHGDKARYILVNITYLWMQHSSQRLWSVKPKQNIHSDVVEDDVWHTAPDMLDKKYL
jgi:hypothetical protein